MNEKNIEWWKELKPGDKVVLDVKKDDPNYWRLEKKNEVYFDGIYEPKKGMEKYFDPVPKFQFKEEDIGKKDSGFGIPIENIMNVKSVNGVEVEHKHKTERAKRMETRLKYVPNNFEISEMNGKYICPCWSPENPEKYVYSKKSTAMVVHKRHLARQNL